MVRFGCVVDWLGFGVGLAYGLWRCRLLGFCLILCSWLLIFAFRCGGSCVGLYFAVGFGFL